VITTETKKEESKLIEENKKESGEKSVDENGKIEESSYIHKPLMVEITFQVESSLRFSFEQVLNERGDNMQEQFIKFMKEYIMSK